MIDLRSVLERNPECATNSARLKNVLNDLYPNERREINLIINALESGVATSISAASKVDEVLLNQSIIVLENEYGIQRDMALIAIGAWASAYGVEIEIIRRATTSDIVNKYFTDEEHIYCVNNAYVLGPDGAIGDFRINTKHMIISWKDIETNRGYKSIYGYGYFTVWYKESGDKVLFGLIANREENKEPKNPFVFEFDNSNEKDNFIVFLQCLKDGSKYFTYPFDDSIIPSNSICEEGRVWKKYFSGNQVKPISFSARCIEHDEVSGDGIMHRDKGICSVTIGIDSEMSYEEAILDNFNTVSFRMKVVESDGSGIVSTMNIENMKWDVYLNKSKNSFFIGNHYEYQQFIITDHELLQDAFNYVAALCSQNDFWEFKYNEEYEDEIFEIEETKSLDIFIDDFERNKTLKSCCSIIDITYKYAANIESEYPRSIQEKYYGICLDYIEKLKKLPKRGKAEKAYNYLALFVEGNICTLCGDFERAVKAYKECGRNTEFEGVEDEWPDDRIDVKIAVHSNLYFIYDILGIEFGKSVEERIVTAAIKPGLSHDVINRDRLDTMIKQDPSKAKETFGNGNSSYSTTNESMLNFYNERIKLLSNWKNNPRFRYMTVGFSDYGNFSISDFAEAVFEYDWGEVSISGLSEEYILETANNAVCIKGRYFSDADKIIVEDLCEYREKVADKIRLLYTRI